jgi:dihydrofolate reductase
MIVGIVCVDNKWSIGKNNDLLFRLKEDMKFFKEKTTNHIVVMGENTLLSLPGGKPLKDRINIVLCPEGHKYDGCLCVHDFDELIAKLKVCSIDTYIIGGGMLYNSMLDYYDKVYVTKVNADGDGTVFFPNLDDNVNFELVNCSEDIEDNGYIINFCTYERRADE